MVFLRASLIAVGITTIAASVTASSDLDRWNLEGANRTENTAGVKAVLAAAPRVFSYCGADVAGGDIFTKRYPSPNDCVANCLASTGCNAGTWTRFEGGTCYFKRIDEDAGLNRILIPNAGAISFLRTTSPSPAEVPTPLFSFDMPGNDYTNVVVGPAVSGLPRCVGLCSGDAKCSAWSWSAYNGGTCWLKTKPSAYVSVAAPVTASGIVGHQRTAAACLAVV